MFSLCKNKRANVFTPALFYSNLTSSILIHSDTVGTCVYYLEVTSSFISKKGVNMFKETKRQIFSQAIGTILGYYVGITILRVLGIV